jgi:hypothetical protein
MCSLFYGDLILNLDYTLVVLSRHGEHFRIGLTNPV